MLVEHSLSVKTQRKLTVKEQEQEHEEDSSFFFLNIVVFVSSVYISIRLRKYSTLFRPDVFSSFFYLPGPGGGGGLIRPPLLTPRILKLWQRNFEGS